MWSIDKLQDIWQSATKWHDGQKYGGPKEGEQIEYLNHIGSVTFEILAAVQMQHFENADLAIRCAVLHDTIEDTEQSYEDIREQFGKETADGVAALTKRDDIQDKTQKMQDSLNRIKQQPKEIWAIKMADRICNLYAPPYYWTNDKKKAYIKEAKLILTELGEGNAYFAKRLKEKIEAYRGFIT